MKYLALILTCLSAYAAPIGFNQNDSLNYGLVGWWTMNEGSGTNAFDYSGNGNAGTLVNSFTFPVWTNGVSGSSLYFASGNYVSIPFTYTNTTGAISFWLFGGPKGALQYLLGKSPINSSKGVYFFSSDTNTLICQFQGGGVNAGGVPITNINSTGWNHIVFVFNYTNTSYGFLNGRLNGSASASMAWGFDSSPVRIGKSIHSFWGVFNGTLDDVRFYNRALSADEVKQLYGGGYGSQ